MFPTTDSLFAFVRSLGGEELATYKQHRPFKVSVNANALEFTPGSSSQPRVERREHVEAFLVRLGATGSLQPGQYHDITFNSSYLLALVRRWQCSSAAV